MTGGALTLAELKTCRAGLHQYKPVPGSSHGCPQCHSRRNQESAQRHREAKRRRDQRANARRTAEGRRRVLREPGTASGWLYFITDESARVKVGAARRNPRHRLVQLQNGNAERLTISAAIQVDDVFGVERDVHIRLAPYRCRPGGEWFDNSGGHVSRALDTIIDEQAQFLSDKRALREAILGR